MLEPGLHGVPRGHLASVVTHLEMREAPVQRDAPDPGLTLAHVAAPGTDWYRQLFRHVGADWLWFGRLVLDDKALAGVIGDPAVRVHVVRDGAAEAGLLELDFRTAGECELAYFGLAPGHTGRGAGRWLMNRALEMAWQPGIGRVHVHTCTLDHPAALDFYRRSGFAPVRREIEVAPDPRATGFLPETAAPHVPFLRPPDGEKGTGD
ncbi:GNAT family N-acetyltransferase [Roseovarius salinarum]|uniref:GNAT family N-acetyltransferase n=1 Tax=Roseovarius salinarum TaxID=1981892 RepID=UPI000C31C437|nr:GNAT family N-acetyltransferase [Roseovarius salinarum]